MKHDRLGRLGMLLAGGALTMGALQAQTSGVTYDLAAVEKGLAISPVQLNMAGKDRNQVGYGSYLVNATGGCNDCHTNPSYTPDGDPFRGLPKKVNSAGYLAGGQAFGPFTSRNITPSADGPVLGNLATFKRVIRTGEDTRKLHPQISPLLQVMPWPVYQDLNDKELDAIYAFLSAIPCVEGGLEERANRCTVGSTAPRAVAGPKELTTFQNQIELDATRSASPSGGALTYKWEMAPGSPTASISKADTANPIVQFPTGPTAYVFALTVTDAAGRTAKDTVTVNFARTAF
jgi:hypothetical protein